MAKRAGDLNRNDIEGALEVLRDFKQRNPDHTVSLGLCEYLVMLQDDPTEYLRRVKEEFGDGLPSWYLCRMLERINGIISTEDPNATKHAAHTITKVVEKTFDTHPLTNITQREVKRRIEIALNLVARMRCDLKWSVQRTLDTLPQAMKAELDGVEWKPSRHAMWMPGDGL